MKLNQSSEGDEVTPDVYGVAAHFKSTSEGPETASSLTRGCLSCQGNLKNQSYSSACRQAYSLRAHCSQAFPDVGFEQISGGTSPVSSLQSNHFVLLHPVQVHNALVTGVTACGVPSVDTTARRWPDV